MADTIRVKYRGKLTTFTRRKDGTFRVAGKKPTAHQKRLASSLFRQQAKGLKPSVYAARGHHNERGKGRSEVERRKQFYEQYGYTLMTQTDVEDNALLSLGTTRIGNRVVKQSWGSPWRTANPRLKYDWYAIVHAFPRLNADGTVGSPDFSTFDDGADFEEEMRKRAETPFDLVIPIYPDGADVGSTGFLMDEVITNFEDNVAAMMRRLDYIPADKDADEPTEVDPDEVPRYLRWVFRHRRTPKDRTKA